MHACSSWWQPWLRGIYLFSFGGRLFLGGELVRWSEGELLPSKTFLPPRIMISNRSIGIAGRYSIFPFAATNKTLMFITVANHNYSLWKRSAGAEKSCQAPSCLHAEKLYTTMMYGCEISSKAIQAVFILCKRTYIGFRSKLWHCASKLDPVKKQEAQFLETAERRR